jgi:hypothetical protein
MTDCLILCISGLTWNSRSTILALAPPSFALYANMTILIVHAIKERSLPILHGHITLRAAYQLSTSAYPRNLLARFHPFIPGCSPPVRTGIPHAIRVHVCPRTIAGYVGPKTPHLASRIPEHTINRHGWKEFANGGERCVGKRSTGI